MRKFLSQSFQNYVTFFREENNLGGQRTFLHCNFTFSFISANHIVAWNSGSNNFESLANERSLKVLDVLLGYHSLEVS